MLIARAFTAVALAAVLVFAPVANGFLPRMEKAEAQPQQPIDFQDALEGYGHWIQHPRWGAVWVPDQVAPGWQPYRLGRWVFTDEWGWYWDSAEDFGWVTYHYGRWLFDRDLGWIWIPGDEWGPAWVNWRQGDDFVGWAPQPPDDYLDQDDNPDTYMFVRAGDLLAPEIYAVILPPQQRFVYFGRSSLVNRSMAVSGRRFGVNPGIPPAFVARHSGRPFHSASIAPVVLGGTVGVIGAVVLHDGFKDRERTRATLHETQRTFHPGDSFQKLKPLQKGEPGRLGDAKLNSLRGTGNFQPALKKNFVAPNPSGGQAPKEFEKKSLKQIPAGQNNSNVTGAEHVKQFQQTPNIDSGQPRNFERKSFQPANPQGTQKTFQPQLNNQIHPIQPQNNQPKHFEQRAIQPHVAPPPKNPPPQRGSDKDKKN